MNLTKEKGTQDTKDKIKRKRGTDHQKRKDLSQRNLKETRYKPPKQ